MSNTIRHKRSSVPSAVPLPEQLVLGELAVNVADGRLFLKKVDGTIVDFARSADYYTRGEVESLIVIGMSRTKRYFFGGNV